MKEDTLKTTFPKLNEPENMLNALKLAIALNTALIIVAAAKQWWIATAILTANLLSLAYQYMKKRKE